MLSGPQVTAPATPAGLLERFQSASERQRRSLLPQLQLQAEAVRPLILDHIAALDATGDDWAAGSLIQMLIQGEPGQREAFFSRYPSGWLATTSARGIDYAPLQRALAQQEFEQADRITSAVLRQLAGPAAVQRGYVYYSEVPAMASVDLDALERLWICYSRGRFGFTVQARLLAAAAGRWERLWPRLGWKDGSQWTRYPGGFQWTIEAPEGHMPLVNQLRGVRLMDALLQHPALLQRRQG
ncbi:MAG: GUN4 domain-containing protein [Prochlorococcaceae cyanobacterium]